MTKEETQAVQEHFSDLQKGYEKKIERLENRIGRLINIIDAIVGNNTTILSILEARLITEESDEEEEATTETNISDEVDSRKSTGEDTTPVGGGPGVQEFLIKSS